MGEKDQDELVRLKAGLSQSRYPQVREIEVSLTSKGVVLTGTVSSFYMKQMAQETLRSLNGYHRICNDLKVTDRPESVTNDDEG